MGVHLRRETSSRSEGPARSRLTWPIGVLTVLSFQVIGSKHFEVVEGPYGVPGMEPTSTLCKDAGKRNIGNTQKEGQKAERKHENIPSIRAKDSSLFQQAKQTLFWRQQSREQRAYR